VDALMSKRVLYISYDGMTDSLGQSQVLAYLKRLSGKGYEFDILSFEKQDRYDEFKQMIAEQLKPFQITWIPMPYTKTPPVLSTIKDLANGWRAIRELMPERKYALVHCRGYVASILGMQMKKRYGCGFLFDMRGWWADEKKESGLWSNPVFVPVYKYFKSLEKKFFALSDFSISLTYAGKQKIQELNLKQENIAVIPTCVDFSVFHPFDNEIRKEIRQNLEIPENARVILYSGALGANYNNEGIFSIFSAAQKHFQDLYLLILSKDGIDYVNEELDKLGIDKKNVRIKSCSYQEVGSYLMAGDVGIILYKKQFSAIGRSPTKLGEYWASGLPTISVFGLGDLDEIIASYPAGGELIDELKEDKIVQALESLFEKSKNKSLLREMAKDYFSIESGVEKYDLVYKAVLHQ
jgi:glycosyltransferase involved in cell wall biosynthesis